MLMGVFRLPFGSYCNLLPLLRLRGGGVGVAVCKTT